MRDLPSGTVTFLFTDVEGSTRLLHELGAEAYTHALAEHRRVIREACARHEGVEVDTQGDAFFFAFPSAPGAVAAAGEMTEALAAGLIQVRIGLHTGTPLLTEEGYIGNDVHFAARVAGSGHGGQVVLSSSTAALIEPSGSEPQALSLLDLGEHRLKDIEGAVSIFQLGSGAFPPLKTISNTNLPRPASSFLGREAELREVLTRIESGARLVSLTGPGGTGKTRLAIEAAATLVPAYKAGVFWVGLASLRDPVLATETISQTLGAKDGLAEHIGERQMLLVLDNLEQVIEAAHDLSSLLSACPNLTLLATSRELLRVSGEVEYPVPPLAEPEAVSLFCERAQTEPSEDIAELCARLDSLPLAVELAAARTKALSPAQILERLSQRLDLLKGGRDADPRQRTLRATIEWSYDLLSPEEQQLFARLCVFAGGCTLEAAEEVCDADLDTLQSLVEKSLLRHTNERYWMLETIREYAAEGLEGSGEAEKVRERHAEYVLALAANASDRLRASDDIQLLNELELEQNNVRVALAWLRQTEQVGAQLDLVGRISRFWGIRGFWLEGLRWSEEALAGSEGERSARRAKVLHQAGLFAWSLGDWDRARSYMEESLSISRELADPREIARALTNLGTLAMNLGNDSEAAPRFEEAAVYARTTEDPASLSPVTGNLATLATRARDYERAITLYEEALAIGREHGQRHLVASWLYGLAESLRGIQRTEDAVAAAKESLTLAHALGDAEALMFAVHVLGSLAPRRGNAEMGARLIGVADVLRESTGYVPTSADYFNEVVQELRTKLGQERYDAAVAEGRAMSLDDAVEYALSSVD